LEADAEAAAGAEAAADAAGAAPDAAAASDAAAGAGAAAGASAGADAGAGAVADAAGADASGAFFSPQAARVNANRETSKSDFFMFVLSINRSKKKIKTLR